MKIKLKVSKTLKRELKTKAVALEMERPVFIKSELLKHIKEFNNNSDEEVQKYISEVTNRDETLKTLKESLDEDESLTDDLKRQKLYDFYKENHFYKHVVSKQRKLENIIFDLDELNYYRLLKLAQDAQMTIENYTERTLHHFK